MRDSHDHASLAPPGPASRAEWPGWADGTRAAAHTLRSRFTRPVRAALVRWRPAGVQLAVLLVVAAGLIAPAPVLPDALPGGWSRSDLMNSHWPAALLIQRTVAREHRLPLWNPFYGGGQPLAADPLAALFYPPTLLVHVLPLRMYFLTLILGHLVWAGAGTLLLARRALGLPRLPALVAAVSFMGAPPLIAHLGAGHLTMLQVVAWYPWLALACWATVRHPRRWGAALAGCVALALLAGHPQMAYYGLLMTAGLAVWLLAGRWRRAGARAGARAMLAPAAALGLAVAIGALLASAHLIPLLELMARSTRDVAVNSTDAYPPLAFLAALFGWQRPSSAPWEWVVTPGIVVLALAALAVATRPRATWPLALGVVIAAGLALGNASPLYRLAAWALPELDRFRGLARIWFVALLPLALLAGLGAEWVLDIVRLGHGAVRGFLSHGAGRPPEGAQPCAPTAGGAGRQPTAPTTGHGPSPAAVPSSRRAVTWGRLGLVILALSLAVVDIPNARVADVGTATAPTALARTAARLAGTGRIYGAQRNVRQAQAVELGVRLADGWNPLLLASYVAYMARAGGYSARGYQLTIPPTGSPARPDAALLGLMDVRVVLSRTPLTDPRLVPAGAVDGTLIYRNTADAGPGYLVRPGPSGGPPALDHVQLLGAPTAAARATQLTSEAETFSFTTSAPAYFVVATPDYPGWTARLDGRPVAITDIAGVLPAVRVAPGRHVLSYTYAPRSVVLGAALSALGLFALLAWLMLAVPFAGIFRSPLTPRRGCAR